MEIRPFDIEKDFDIIKGWIGDERTCAMWCANHAPYPLEKESFAEFLHNIKEKTSDEPFVAVDENDRPVGFYTYSVKDDTKEGFFKFVMVDSNRRGQGIGKQMMKLAVKKSFENPEVPAAALCVFSENPGAKKCYEGAGFKETQTVKHAFVFKNEIWGRCYMAVKRGEE
ncbi:MAG: GNAT family N-acetyltransferase [Lachnospiraceae bacterium]|nr:GNAT family N-acetyltransferase [Lachnospiraceae bacterium]